MKVLKLIFDNSIEKTAQNYSRCLQETKNTQEFYMLQFVTNLNYSKNDFLISFSDTNNFLIKILMLANTFSNPLRNSD